MEAGRLGLMGGGMTEIPTGLQFAEVPLAPTKMNVILYGAAKSGKSTAAATSEGPILWVNLEGPGALGFARKRAADRGTVIHEARIGKDDDPRPVLREVVRHIRSGEEPRPRTVVIDTVGKLREGLAKKIVEKNSRNSLGQWGEVGDVIKEVVGALRDEPVNVVLICHEDVTEGEGDEPRLVRPLIGGKVTAYVLGEVDVIGYCGAVQHEDGIRYVAQLVEGKGRVAGDRSGGLGSVRELDLSDWWVAYRDALTPDSDLPWSGAIAPLSVSAEPAPGSGDAASSPPGGDATPEPTLLPLGEAPIDATLAAAEKEAEGGELTDEEQALLDEPVEPVELSAEDLRLLDAVRVGKGLVRQTAGALHVTPDVARIAVAELKERLHFRTNTALLEFAERRLAE